ncbi:hypothetical protein CCR75_007093 [Bremia lactucae]|uniref:Uncharacterized protein n=1 Tax=Bremia lactucae TaxID=4779 RepID=A0A976FSK9_BRELC|nr:hypothetical protein CCR75_007093 [Bremia lactucae]
MGVAACPFHQNHNRIPPTSGTEKNIPLHLMQPHSPRTLQAAPATPVDIHSEPLTWPDVKDLHAAVTVHTRKRQRPFESSPTSFSTPEDLKLDFTGFEVDVNTAPSDMPLTHLSLDPSGMTYPPTQTAMGYTGYYPTAVSEDIVSFLKTLQLAHDATTLVAITQRLAQNGFDSTLALAFASVTELQQAGVVEAPLVWQQIHRHFQCLRYPGPGILSPSSSVSRWLELCGIPKATTYTYAEYLGRLGYACVRDLTFLLHDQRALEMFKTGHSRLVTHFMTLAATPSEQPPPVQVASYPYTTHSCNVYTAGSSNALLQPLEFQRENDFDVRVYDSFLEALIEPTDAERFQHFSIPETITTSPENDAPHAPLSDSTDEFEPRLSFHATSSPLASNLPLRLLPQEHLQLLYEAVNLPRPNPCRRGKKIYWSVLATGGMKIERFTPLTQFTAPELQNAYLRQFELPTPTLVKVDAWSHDNIRQLEQAVKDPRCRHLSKVCWEMLATGRTGVDEYAPLAKFTASQLRSRFRSLFGDKRPQKLRQKKQLLKLQQHPKVSRDERLI